VDARAIPVQILQDLEEVLRCAAASCCTTLRCTDMFQPNAQIQQMLSTQTFITEFLGIAEMLSCLCIPEPHRLQGAFACCSEKEKEQVQQKDIVIGQVQVCPHYS